MDRFAGESDVGGGGFQTVPDWNGFRPTIGRHFAPLLRRVVFVGEAKLTTLIVRTAVVDYAVIRVVRAQPTVERR